MLILVDQDIPHALPLFGPLGNVRTFAGRSLTAADVREADALVVRSVTRVDESLLTGSCVAFVGTATSGEDHVDVQYLRRRGIAFASAAGCNAIPVAEYVLAAILLAAVRRGIDPRAWTVGVVGVGHVGSIVADWCVQIGLSVMRCDPPRAWAEGGAFEDFAQLAAVSDIITLHVPLTRDGPNATLNMVNSAWLARCRPGAMLINTARGEVVDEAALLAAVRSGHLSEVALDVWRNEPSPARDLVSAATWATPHMAGYSAESRSRGARIIRDALAAWRINSRPPTMIQVDVPIRAATGEPRRANAATDEGAAGRERSPLESQDAATNTKTPRTDAIEVSMKGPWWEAASAVLDGCVRLTETSREMREGGGAGFDALRAGCASRREFSARRVAFSDDRSDLARVLRLMGFHIV